MARSVRDCPVANPCSRPILHAHWVLPDIALPPAIVDYRTLAVTPLEKTGLPLPAFFGQVYVNVVTTRQGNELEILELALLQALHRGWVAGSHVSDLTSGTQFQTATTTIPGM